MTENNLITAGYQTFPPNKHMGDTWRIGYQKAVWNGDVRRYFISVHVYDRSKYLPDDPVGYEASFQSNDGCQFFPSAAAMRIQICGDLDKWSVLDLERVAKIIHDRLDVVSYDKKIE